MRWGRFLISAAGLCGAFSTAGGLGIAPSLVAAADVRSELAPFQDRELQLVRFAVNGTEIVIPPKASMTLTLHGGGQISGHSAVNNYTGVFRVTPDGKIAIELTAATQMAGVPELMRLEKKYFEALPRVTRIGIQRNRIILEDQETSLEFARSKEGVRN
jgi:heat shock protein HslJ